MPIRPENRARYPRGWATISRKRRARAGNRCEGSPAYPDCRAENGKPHPATGSRVVLTVAHLNHKPEDCREENLRAWCQRCHNTYDAPVRRAGVLSRKRAAKAVGELFAAILAVSLPALALTSQAQAQPCDVEVSERNALMLSRVAVSESGWDSPNDHAAILAVLCDVRRRAERRLGRNLSIAWAARRYSPYATGARQARRGRQRWVAGLNLQLTKPRKWPRDLPWERFEPMWEAVVLRSFRLLEGEEDNLCKGEVSHWGGPMDDHRAKAAGFVRVDCGDTLNRFWRYP